MKTNTKKLLVLLLVFGTSAFGQFKPISHALKVTFDLKPQNPYQTVFEGTRYGLAGWDFKTTIDYLPIGECTESNPLLGKHPSTVRLVGEGMALEVGLSRFDNFLQKRIHKKSDRIAATAIVNLPVALLHGVAAANNSHCMTAPVPITMPQPIQPIKINN